jgi:hypothetical protein
MSLLSRILPPVFAAVFFITAVFPGQASAAGDDTYEMKYILRKAQDFFGTTTKGLAEAIQKVFAEKGRPNAYITGEEASGAIVVGLRYGQGELNRKNGERRKIFWQGPTVGFDFGANASKVFTLIYHLNKTDELFQRIPGVEGSIYIVAGVGVNYQQTGDLILAPIRTGVGWRGGVNVGYVHYGKKQSWIPF